MSTSLLTSCAAAIDNTNAHGPLPFTISAKLPKQQGGTGGRVLTLNILQIGGKPKLVMLAASTAVFSSRWEFHSRPQCADNHCLLQSCLT